ncbi:TonB-dependent receptor [Sphingomonas koreensis]|nr:TonB-dependent receptor [Sphingomonas koreensis]
MECRIDRRAGERRAAAAACRRYLGQHPSLGPHQRPAERFAARRAFLGVRYRPRHGKRSGQYRPADRQPQPRGAEGARQPLAQRQCRGRGAVGLRYASHLWLWGQLVADRAGPLDRLVHRGGGGTLGAAARQSAADHAQCAGVRFRAGRDGGHHPHRRRQSQSDRRQSQRDEARPQPAAAQGHRPQLQCRLQQEHDPQSDRVLSDRDGRDRGRVPGSLRARRQRRADRLGEVDAPADLLALADKITIRDGPPELDLLNGSATGSRGGSPRHQIELRTGVVRDGIGIRLNADWQSATRVRGGATSADELRFDDFATVNLRLFATLGPQFKFVRDNRWLAGTRVTMSVDNLFDSRLKVTNAAGTTPLSYQPALLDPLGRTVKISVRKLFF